MVSAQSEPCCFVVVPASCAEFTGSAVVLTACVRLSEQFASCTTTIVSQTSLAEYHLTDLQPAHCDRYDLSEFCGPTGRLPQRSILVGENKILASRIPSVVVLDLTGFEGSTTHHAGLAATPLFGSIRIHANPSAVFFGITAWSSFCRS